MELRNLHRRARPFRYFAFWSMAVQSLLLLQAERDPALVTAVAGFCAGWPVWADHQAARSADANSDARRAVRTHLFECIACGVMFGALSFPPLVAEGAALALLAGVTAQAGLPLFALALPVLAVATCAGLMLAPVLTLATTPLVDSIAMVFTLVFAVALAEVSFQQARRLHVREQTANGRARRLESMTDRMTPYLTPSLRARLATAGDGTASAESGTRNRRWLTVAFVDLAGFTELAARVDAETLATLLDEYLAGVCELALRQGGEVTKVLGDGVLAAFGLDPPAERRAAATGAVRFCEGVRPLLDALARGWHARGEPIELKMRAGIASGHCTVGDWGGAGYRDFTMIGSAVNLASRLEGSAPVDGVLLDAATVALVEDVVNVGPAHELEVRGLGTVTVRALCRTP
jgi:class 3 adenylate cyclase